MISTKIALDSVNESGERITTFILTYPRFIHSEFMTHRVFSRNAASSRAIPLKKMIATIQENPAAPVVWASEKKGMQGGDEIEAIASAKYEWRAALDDAIRSAERMERLGLHKSIVNRILEPWAHMTVIATATYLENFFLLRDHEAAMPEFRVLARQMREATEESEPQFLDHGEWHIPLADGEGSQWGLREQLMIATAKCARVSYVTHTKQTEAQEDFTLHDRLAAMGHWSPFEHSAQATPGVRSGNFQGWVQYRKTFKRGVEGGIP